MVNAGAPGRSRRAANRIRLGFSSRSSAVSSMTITRSSGRSSAASALWPRFLINTSLDTVFRQDYADTAREGATPDPPGSQERRRRSVRHFEGVAPSLA
jgi:hypothetical protein